MTDSLTIERDGDVVVATLNRPAKLNALNRELLTELTRQLGGLAEQTDAERPRAVVLTGAGDKAFAAGADIRELSGLEPSAAKALSELGHRLARVMEEAPFPILAAVNGFALGGGCELALACDFIYAADSAKFGLPEVTLGLIPGFGGTQRLQRRLPSGVARELVFTGKSLDAPTARALGLVNQVFSAAELLERSKETARAIAAHGPLAVAAAKRVLRRGADVDLTSACELESAHFASLFATEDAREGTRAFLEKRAPTFKAR